MVSSMVYSPVEERRYRSGSGMRHEPMLIRSTVGSSSSRFLPSCLYCRLAFLSCIVVFLLSLHIEMDNVKDTNKAGSPKANDS